jgi:hypothetical protein
MRLTAGREDDRDTGGINCDARRFDPLNRKREIVEWRLVIAGRVFDRQSGNAGFYAPAHVLSDAGWVVRERIQEIRIDRQRGTRGDVTKMVEHSI